MRPEHLQNRNDLLIAGIMSGTSLDGVDVALVRTVRRSELLPDYHLESFVSIPFDDDIAQRLMSASDGSLPMRDVAMLDVELALLYAEGVRRAAEEMGVRKGEIDAIGLHGQTVWHNPGGEPRGRTVQLGSAALLAEETRSVVVYDFRSADVAAGGEGAPLVPWFDHHFLRSTEANRLLLNIGGISNITWLPRNADRPMVAFDTGPGNVWIDGATKELYGRPYDDGGKIGSEGKILPDLLADLLADDYYQTPPPRSTGRELFSHQRLQTILADLNRSGTSPADVIATLTRLTAETIVRSVESFATQGEPIEELIVSGGGGHNVTLIGMLQSLLPTTRVIRSDEIGIPGDAKEAICFALLAWATLHGIPGNLPEVTGAGREVVLGGVVWPG